MDDIRGSGKSPALSLFQVEAQDGCRFLVAAENADQAEDLAIEDPDKAAKSVREVDHAMAQKIRFECDDDSPAATALDVLLQTHVAQVIGSTED